jgi:hypothetical protein
LTERKPEEVKRAYNGYIAKFCKTMFCSAKREFYKILDT